MKDKLMKKRIIMCVAGVMICGISVGFFKFAALGVDPFQSFMSGLDALIPIEFGTLYVIANICLLMENKCLREVDIDADYHCFEVDD